MSVRGQSLVWKINEPANWTPETGIDGLFQATHSFFIYEVFYLWLENIAHRKLQPKWNVLHHCKERNLLMGKRHLILFSHVYNVETTLSYLFWRVSNLCGGPGILNKGYFVSISSPSFWFYTFKYLSRYKFKNSKPSN